MEWFMSEVKNVPDKKRLICPSCNSSFVHLFPAGTCEECDNIFCGHCIHHDHPDFNGTICNGCLDKKTPMGKLAQLEYEPLLNILKDPSAQDRGLAARIFGRKKESRAVDTLCRILADSDPIDVRREAAVALGDIGSSKAIPSLLNTLDDPTPAIRSRAAESLARLGASEAVPKLRHMLDDPSAQAAGHAVHALTALTGKEACPLLDDVIRNHLSGPVRCQALECLTKLDPDLGFKAALFCLEDKQKDVLIFTCKLINHLNDIRAVPGLQKLIESRPAASVRHTASAVLKNLLQPNE